jgi:hypothetical protein
MLDTSKQPDKKDSATTSACAGTAFPAQARNVVGQNLCSPLAGLEHSTFRQKLFYCFLYSRMITCPGKTANHHTNIGASKPVPDDGEQQSCLRVLPTIVSVAKPVIQTPA